MKLPDLVLPEAEIDAMGRPLENDLLAVFKLIEEETLRLLDMAKDEGWTPEQLEREIEALIMGENRTPTVHKTLSKIEGQLEVAKDLLSKSLTFSGHKLQGRTKFQGMDISIENKAGSKRKGTDKDGHDWETKMHFDYGYIRGTVGKDKDHLDCYLGPNEESEKVFVVHQNDPVTGKYDEDKIMLGFDSAKEAKTAYLKQYDRPGFFGDMVEMTMEDFQEKIFDKKNQGKKL